MLRYGTIIKSSFVLKSLSEFWDYPWSNCITCSTNGAWQTRPQTPWHCTKAGFV